MSLAAKLFNVKMALHHVLYISYLLPVSSVRPVVPNIIPLSIVNSDKVFVSIVSMRCGDVRFANLPWPSFNYNQLNLRTYVKDPKTGRNAVYFLRSGVTSAMTSYSTSIIGVPWQRIRFELDIADGSEKNYTSYRASGNWNGEIRILASDSRSEINPSGLFEDSESLVAHITGPLIGMTGPQDKPRRFEIRHRSLDVRAGELHDIELPASFSAGILNELDVLKPHNVLLVPEAEFTILLPPRKV